MAVSQHLRDRYDRFPDDRPERVLVGITAGVLALLWLILPGEFVLPVFSAAALTGGLAIAYSSRFPPSQANHRVTWRDLAGAAVLLGFAAGTLADHRPLERLVEFAAP